MNHITNISFRDDELVLLLRFVQERKRNNFPNRRNRVHRTFGIFSFRFVSLRHIFPENPDDSVITRLRNLTLIAAVQEKPGGAFQPFSCSQIRLNFRIFLFHSMFVRLNLARPCCCLQRPQRGVITSVYSL